MKNTTLLILLSLFIISCGENLVEEIVYKFDDGSPKVIEYYRINGEKKELVRKKAFNQDGEMMGEENYKNGKVDGKVFYIQSNKFGEIEKIKGKYLNNEPDGIWTMQYEDGTIKEERHYQKGVSVGEWNWYDKMGEKEMWCFYNDGILDTCNPFIGITNKDKVDAHPKYDFVSNYDWENIYLTDLPYDVLPSGVLGNQYFDWYVKVENNLKTHSIVESIYSDWFRGGDNTDSWNQIDYESCRMTNKEFYGQVFIKDKILQCKQMELTSESIISMDGEFGSEVGIGYKWKLFTDFNNDDFMDVIIWFYQIGMGSDTDALKVILTKKSEKQQLFEIVSWEKD